MATPASNSSPAWDALLTAAHVWKVRTDEPHAPAQRDRWLRWLSAVERARYERFRTEKLRESYLARRAFCRATLSRYAGVDPSQWRFAEGAYGKPTLVGPGEFTSLRFNLTHTEDVAMCIVSRAGEVGVDVEKISPAVDVASLARHFLSRREQAKLSSLAPRERTARFFEQWVLKEAYVKALGKGLAYAPERLTIAQGNDGEPIARASCQFSLYRPDSSHVAAAAILRGRRVRAVSIEWLPAAGNSRGLPLQRRFPDRAPLDDAVTALSLP